MTVVRKKKSEIGKGRVNRERLRQITDRDIERWQKSEGTLNLGVRAARFVPSVNVRELRERLKMTQHVFASTFSLPLRTVQEWEQDRREPNETARLYLYLISEIPKQVEKALRRK